MKLGLLTRRALLAAAGFSAVAGVTAASPIASTYKLEAERAMVRLLENRFERAEVADWSQVTGLVVPCGSVGRIAEAMRLAHQHPHLKIIMNGPGPEELAVAFGDSAVHLSRIIVEHVSLNTYGNARLAKQLANPARHERWLLVTSASHMPRAMGSFYQVGFHVEPWPVYDVTGTQTADLAIPTVAHHEWMGLLTYWLRGRTIAIVPGRSDVARVRSSEHVRLAEM